MDSQTPQSCDDALELLVFLRCRYDIHHLEYQVKMDLGIIIQHLYKNFELILLFIIFR